MLELAVERLGAEVLAVAAHLKTGVDVGLVGGDEDDVEGRVGVDHRLLGVLVLGDLLGRFGADRDPGRLHGDRPVADRDADPGRRLRARVVGVFGGTAAGDAAGASAPSARPPLESTVCSRPIERNLAERQVDHPSRNAIFTYGQLRPWLGLAAHDRQADRAEGGGDAGAAEPADLLLAQPQARRPAAARPLSSSPRRSPVGTALVVEAGDRLLADVAALGEADRALDDAGLGGHRLGAHLGAEARRPGLDPHDLGGLGGDLDRAGARSGRRADARRRLTAAIRSTPTSVPTARHSTPPTAVASQAFSGSAGVPAISTLRGPIRERIARSAVRSAIATSRPIVYIFRWRRAASSASGSVSSQISFGRGAQHPHVGLHVALAVQQRRVLALAGLERLDVVGQLPLQVLGRLGRR